MKGVFRPLVAIAVLTLLLFYLPRVSAEVSHPADEIGPGTFSEGVFIFSGDSALSMLGDSRLRIEGSGGLTIKPTGASGISSTVGSGYWSGIFSGGKGVRVQGDVVIAGAGSLLKAPKIKDANDGSYYLDLDSTSNVRDLLAKNIGVTTLLNVPGELKANKISPYGSSSSVNINSNLLKLDAQDSFPGTCEPGQIAATMSSLQYCIRGGYWVNLAERSSDGGDLTCLELQFIKDCNFESLTASKFMDSDSNAYYLDPYSTSKLRYLDVESIQSYGEISTSGNVISLNGQGQFANGICIGGDCISDWSELGSGTGTGFGCDDIENCQISSLKADKIVDTNIYTIDPEYTSYFNEIYANDLHYGVWNARNGDAKITHDGLSDDLVVDYETGNVGIGISDPNKKLVVDGAVDVNEVCINGKCTDLKLQCPPRRVMVKEETSNWDEWAYYSSCERDIEYIVLNDPKISDNGGDRHHIQWDECSNYCEEFGFFGGHPNTGDADCLDIDESNTDPVYEFLIGTWYTTDYGSDSCLKCACYPSL